MPLLFTHDAGSHTHHLDEMPQGHRLSVTSRHVTTRRCVNARVIVCDVLSVYISLVEEDPPHRPQSCTKHSHSPPIARYSNRGIDNHMYIYNIHA